MELDFPRTISLTMAKEKILISGKSWEDFRKWIVGQAYPPNGFYLSDVEEFVGVQSN